MNVWVPRCLGRYLLSVCEIVSLGSLCKNAQHRARHCGSDWVGSALLPASWHRAAEPSDKVLFQICIKVLYVTILGFHSYHYLGHLSINSDLLGVSLMLKLFIFAGSTSLPFILLWLALGNSLYSLFVLKILKHLPRHPVFVPFQEFSCQR